jgi:hypothetical protein
MPETDQKETDAGYLPPKSLDTSSGSEIQTLKEADSFFTECLFPDSGPVRVRFLDLQGKTIDIDNDGHLKLDENITLELELTGELQSLLENPSSYSVDLKAKIDNLNKCIYSYIYDYWNGKKSASELEETRNKVGDDLIEFSKFIKPTSKKDSPKLEATEKKIVEDVVVRSDSIKEDGAGIFCARASKAILNIINYILSLVVPPMREKKSSSFNSSSPALFKAPSDGKFSSDNKAAEAVDIPQLSSSTSASPS